MNTCAANFLEAANLFFTIAFALEALASCAGYGPRHYFADAFSRFDATVVTLSLFELAARDACC